MKYKKSLKCFGYVLHSEMLQGTATTKLDGLFTAEQPIKKNYKHVETSTFSVLHWTMSDNLKIA